MKKPGYILFMTFSILALCTALVSAFLTKGMMHKQVTSIILEQEVMNQLALSIPALAQSFLSFSADDLKGLDKSDKPSGKDQGESVKQDSNEKEDTTNFHKKLLEKILPVVNIPQIFMLKELDNTIPYSINLTFFCESGKININGLYDQVHKKFYNEGSPDNDQKVFATWLFEKIAELTEQKSLLQPFIEHVKQRKLPFNDVTELLSIKEFAQVFQHNIFYDKVVDEKKNKLFLTDVFTATSEDDTIQPWLLSPSVCALLGIEKEQKTQEFENKANKKIDLSGFKITSSWQTDWDALLKPVYGITYDKIPLPVTGVLSKEFKVNVFSIGVTITRESIEGENNIKTRIFAILKEKKLPDDSITYDIIKVYLV